jgi:hypothetical protein
MAVLTANFLASCRNMIERDRLEIDYTKAQANAAAQAIEDFFESNRAALNTQINTATTPLVLSNQIKRRLIRAVLLEKFTRGD